MNFRQFQKLTVQLKYRNLQQLSNQLNITSARTWISDPLCPFDEGNGVEGVEEKPRKALERSKSLPTPSRQGRNNNAPSNGQFGQSDEFKQDTDSNRNETTHRGIKIFSSNKPTPSEINQTVRREHTSFHKSRSRSLVQSVYKRSYSTVCDEFCRNPPSATEEMGLPYYYKKIRVDDGASGTKPKYEMRRQYFLYPDPVRKQAFDVSSKMEKTVPETVKTNKKSHADCINELIAIQAAGKPEKQVSRTSFPFPANNLDGTPVKKTSFQNPLKEIPKKIEERIPKIFFSKPKVTQEMPGKKTSASFSGADKFVPEMSAKKVSTTSFATPFKGVSNVSQEKTSKTFPNFSKETPKVAEERTEEPSKTFFSKEAPKGKLEKMPSQATVPSPRKEILDVASRKKTTAPSKEISKGRSETSTTSLPNIIRTREEKSTKTSLPPKESAKTSQEKPSKAFFFPKEISHQGRSEKSTKTPKIAPPVTKNSVYLRKPYPPPPDPPKKPTFPQKSASPIKESASHIQRYPKKFLVRNNPNLKRLEEASQKEVLKKLETYFKDKNSFLAPSFDSFHRDFDSATEDRPNTPNGGNRAKYSTIGTKHQKPGSYVLGKSEAFAKISKSDTQLPSCGKKYRTGREDAQNKVSVSVIQDTSSLPKEEYLDYVDQAAKSLKDIYKSEDVLKKTRQINEIEKQYLADQEKRAFTEAKRAMEEYLRITLPKCEQIQKEMKENDSGKLPPHLNPPGAQKKRKTSIKENLDKSKMERMIVGREIGEGSPFSELDKHRPSSPVIKSLDTKAKTELLENITAKEKDDELEIQADVKDASKGDSFYIEKINIEFHLDQDKEYDLEDAKRALEGIREEIQHRKVELDQFKGGEKKPSRDVLKDEVSGTNPERNDAVSKEKDSDVTIQAAYFQIKQQAMPEEEEAEEPNIAEGIDQLGRTISTATTVVGKGSTTGFDSKPLSTNAYKSKTDMNIERREKSGTLRINTINISALEESKGNQITPKVYKYIDPKPESKSRNNYPPVKSVDFPRILEEYDPLPMTIYKMDDQFEKRSSTQLFDLGRENRERLDSIYNPKKAFASSKHSDDDGVSIKTTSETQSVISKPKSSLSSIRSLESRLDEVLTSTKNLIKRETHNDACHFKTPPKSKYIAQDRSEVLAKNEIRETKAESFDEPKRKYSMTRSSQNLVTNQKTTTGSGRKLSKKNSIVLAQNVIKEINIEEPDDFSKVLAATKNLIKRKNLLEKIQKPAKPYPAYDMTTNNRSLIKDLKKKTSSPGSEARAFNTISTEDKTPKELSDALASTKNLLKKKAATEEHNDAKRRTGIPKLIRQKDSVALARNEVKEVVLEPPKDSEKVETNVDLRKSPRLKLSRSFELPKLRKSPQVDFSDTRRSRNATEAAEGKQYTNLRADHSQMIQPLDVHRDGKRAFRTLSSRDIKNYFKERTKTQVKFTRSKSKCNKPKKEKDCCEIAEEEYCQEMCDRRWGKQMRRLDLEALEKTTCPPSMCIKKAKEAKCRMARKKKAAKKKAKEAVEAAKETGKPTADCGRPKKKPKKDVCGKKKAGCAEKCREVMEEMKKGNKKKGDSKKSKKKDYIESKEMSTTCVSIAKNENVENVECIPAAKKEGSGGSGTGAIPVTSPTLPSSRQSASIASKPVLPTSGPIAATSSPKSTKSVFKNLQKYSFSFRNLPKSSQKPNLVVKKVISFAPASEKIKNAIACPPASEKLKVAIGAEKLGASTAEVLEKAPVEKLKKNYRFSKISLAKIHKENAKIIAKPFMKTPKTSLLQEQLKIMQNRQSRGRLHTNFGPDDCTHRSREVGKLCGEKPTKVPSEAEKEELVKMKKQEVQEKREREKLEELQKICQKRREIPGGVDEGPCRGYPARKPIKLPYKKCPKDWLCRMARYSCKSGPSKDDFSNVCRDAAREKRRAKFAVGDRGNFEERSACGKRLEVAGVPKTVLAKLRKRKEKGGDRFKVKAMKVTKHSKPMFLQIRDRMQEKKIEACKWKLNDIIGHAVDQAAGVDLDPCRSKPKSI